MEYYEGINMGDDYMCDRCNVVKLILMIKWDTVMNVEIGLTYNIGQINKVIPIHFALKD